MFLKQKLDRFETGVDNTSLSHILLNRIPLSNNLRSALENGDQSDEQIQQEIETLLSSTDVESIKESLQIVVSQKLALLSNDDFNILKNISDDEFLAKFDVFPQPKTMREVIANIEQYVEPFRTTFEKEKKQRAKLLKREEIAAERERKLLLSECSISNKKEKGNKSNNKSTKTK